MAITPSPGSDPAGSLAGLINPLDFQCLNGRAVVMRSTLTATQSLRIPPDEHRYALSFWAASGKVTIFPDSQNEGDTDGTSFTNTSSPIILTVPAHGVIPCLGWTVTASIPPTTLTWIVSLVARKPCPDANGNGRVKLRAHIVPRR